MTGKLLGVPSGSTLSVLIPGDGRQPVNVDATGAFSVSGVTSPYQLILAEKARNSAVVYQGLTLSTLTLSLPGSASAPDRSASLAGKITGGQTSAFSRVSFVASNGMGEDLSISGDYSVDVNWTGDSTLTGTLYALQFEFSNGDYTTPSRYLGFGQRDNVSLTADARLSGQDITLSPVTNTTLSGSITVPSTYSGPLLSLKMMPRPDAEVSLLAQDFSGKTAFNFVVPQVAQATYSMSLISREKSQGEDDEGAGVLVFKRGLGAGALAAPLTIPEASRLDTPANAAKDVTRSSTFSWSAFANGVHGLSLEQEEGGSSAPFSLTIFTRENQATLPDLSALGMSLPANAHFSWSVLGIAPATSMDAFVGLSAQGDFFNSNSTVFKDLAVGTSRRQTFTTSATP